LTLHNFTHRHPLFDNLTIEEMSACNGLCASADTNASAAGSYPLPIAREDGRERPYVGEGQGEG